MTDYNDLIRRLRGNTGRIDYANLMSDAADAIEELQSQCDAWEITADSERNAYFHWFDSYQKDVPKWVSVKERLPEDGGSFIVYLRPFTGNTDIGYPHTDLSYATEMYFDKGQMLWVGENESYNAVLDVVNTETEYHVTHWTKMLEPPKEET